MNITKAIISLLRLISCFSILYTVIILIFSGIRTSFLWFWPTLAVGTLLYSLLLNAASKNPNQHILHLILLSLFSIAFIIFLCVEIALFTYSHRQESKDADYMIILGAQVRGEVPSLSLQARIDAAAEYMKAHPSVIAVCSGGMGTGESITEAETIRRGLSSHGIEPSRIILEEKSTSTAENFRFSKELLPGTDVSVVIVTNSFHCLRASILAKRTGITNISCYPAGKVLATTFHYYVREFFAIVKTLLLD